MRTFNLDPGGSICRALLTVILVLGCNMARAEDTVQLFIDNNECAIKERGFSQIENPFFIKGEKYGKTGFSSGCTVYVTKKSYEQEFRFCYLSGVTVLAGHGGSCDVSLYKSKGAYAFESSPAGQSSEFSCSFTCIKR